MAALSSKTVLLKLAVWVPLPTPLNKELPNLTWPVP